MRDGQAAFAGEVKTGSSGLIARNRTLLSLGEGRVISPAHSKRLNAALRAEGITVFDPELDCFARGGGRSTA